MSDQAAQASRPARPKVVQPKPTNKASVAAAGAAASAGPSAPPIAGPSSGPAQPARPSTSSTTTSRPTAPKIIAPTTASSSSSTSSILVQSTQRGNPLLKSIRNVAWEFADIPCDYQLGPSRGALFLSLKYHRLHPEYVHDRIAKLKAQGGRYGHSLLLIQSDVPDPQSAIKELTKTTLVNNMTMIVAWTPEEAGRYLEHYKVYENKPADLIRERRGEDFLSHLTSSLTSIPRINRTDVKNLMTRFGSLRNLSRATAADLADLNGFGEIKVRLLLEAFETPFRVGERRTWRERREARARATVGAGGEGGVDDGEEDEIEDDADGMDALRSASAAAGSSHVGGVARGLQEGAEAVGEAGPSSATKRRRVEEEDGARLDDTAPATSGPIDVTEAEDLTLDLNDEDLAALDAAEKLGGATSAPDPGAEAGEPEQPQGEGEGVREGEDEFGDEVNLDELTAEEREELRMAMRMSMAL